MAQHHNLGAINAHTGIFLQQTWQRVLGPAVCVQRVRDWPFEHGNCGAESIIR